MSRLFFTGQEKFALESKLLSILRRHIYRLRNFSDKRSLLRSFKIRVSRDGRIRLTTNYKGFSYLDKGVRPHRMKYLTKKTGPVPIEGKSGSVNFRIPDGNWKHPGFEGLNLLSPLKEEFKTEVKKAASKKLKQELKQRILKK